VLLPLAQVQLDGMQSLKSGTGIKAKVVVAVPVRVFVAIKVCVPPRSVKVTIEGTVADCVTVPVALVAPQTVPVFEIKPVLVVAADLLAVVVRVPVLVDVRD
jgi:hypothetical protein